MCWGFLYGCVQAVFYFHTWQFYSSLIFLIVMSCYFKPILNLLLGFIFAIFVVGIQSELFYSYKPDKMGFIEVSQINGLVTKVISPHTNSLVELKLIELNKQKIPFYKTIKAQLAIKAGAVDFKEGDFVSAKVKLKVFRSRKNKYSFDSELYAFTQQIYFKGTIEELEKRTSAVKTIRQSYRDKIWDTFKGKELNWLFYGLSTGDKSRTPKETKEHVIKLGIGHMLAISGLHVGILVFICFYVVKGAAWMILNVCQISYQRFNLNKLYVALSLLISFQYIYLCYFPVSAIRAWLMVALFSYIYLSKRSVNLVQMLSYALTLVLFLNPFSLLEPGLYLSFIGYATVIWILNKTKSHGFFSNPIIRLLLIQSALLISLAPLSIYYFNGVSIVGLLFNLCVIPLLSLVIFPYIIICLLLNSVSINMDFMFVDYLLSLGLDMTTEYLIDYAWLAWSQLTIETVILFYLIVTLLLIKHFRVFSLVPAFSLISSYSVSKPIWQVDVMDVGHGTSVLVASDNLALLYDLGAKYFNFYSLFERVTLPEIKARGLELRHTIISHDDKDHSGGLDELYAFDNFASLRTFHNGEPLNFCHIKNIGMKNISIQTIWPIENMDSDNNNSCVAKVTGPSGSILLTGDIEFEAEKQLVERYGQILRSDILLVPHHGSKTSSSAEFLETVKPEIGLISRNYFSPWHLPHKTVKERYSSQNIKLIDTALSGQITINFFDDYYEVEQAREKTNFWVKHRYRF
ncbi:DNA internalization-related competence protein ComEC/Rec2 [Pseudoalteromonas phenolica]|uniref:DNA internalization-related competence protein ComEC/Rec2 n=1 Tax=Pseudoalteromonas phenolica TaxID=161398 RepID=UPI0025A31D5A|nr:DNA internalization-related competence protein ComEC/Rec2 [Pseudoalteromonas phenolica]